MPLAWLIGHFSLLQFRFKTNEKKIQLECKYVHTIKNLQVPGHGFLFMNIETPFGLIYIQDSFDEYVDFNHTPAPKQIEKESCPLTGLTCSVLLLQPAFAPMHDSSPSTRELSSSPSFVSRVLWLLSPAAIRSLKNLQLGVQ